MGYFTSPEHEPIRVQKLNAVEARVTAIEADPTTAAEVIVTPTGNIAATNVQGALAELDTEKAPAVHTHAIADVTGLQAALDAKLALTGGTLTGGLIGTTASFSGSVTLGDATSDLHTINGRIIGVSGTGLTAAKFTGPSGANITVDYDGTNVTHLDQATLRVRTVAGATIAEATSTGLAITGTLSSTSNATFNGPTTVSYDNARLTINDTDGTTRQASVVFATAGGNWSVEQNNDLDIKFAPPGTAPTTGGSIYLKRSTGAGLDIRSNGSTVIAVTNAATALTGTLKLSSGLTNAVDDAAAAAAGVAVGQLYRNGSVVMIRVS